MVAGETAEPVSASRPRKLAGPVKRRAGIGAQPIDQTTSRRSHQLGSFRHTNEAPGQPYAVPPLTTRKRP